MYFLPRWDFFLNEELKKVQNNLYYFSGTMMGPKGSGFVDLNCGATADEFDEKKLLENYKNFNLFDHQGSHWAPHLIHKSIWDKIGGFSKEFDPGFASDTDLNMKLWKIGIRIFKGLGSFKVYHFGSVTTRKNKSITQNRGDNTFLLKWGITTKFFKKYYLKSKTTYISPLNNPNFSFLFFLDLIKCKFRFLYLKFVNIFF